MAWNETRMIDTATDIIVYQGATHGEHAGELSVLLATRAFDVYGRGMNTLVTHSTFNGDYPMQEGGSVFFSSWVKVEKLCKLNIHKIVVGFGWGAAITKNGELLTWGKGAATYLNVAGIETIELYDPGAACRFCNGPCNYGRRIGNALFSYCKEQQTLVKYNSSPPPPDVKVKRLGNRRYGALTCPACLMDCDIEVMESCAFNFCNTCNQLWDVDENARPMNLRSVKLESFIRKLDVSVKINDIAPGRWGIWTLSDSNRVRYSTFYMHPDTDTSGMPQWWKQPLSVPFLRPPNKIISIHSNKTDVFAITDTGFLYRRVQVVDRSKSNLETHTLSRIPLENRVKKMCCGRFASLCLLDNGAVWVVYSQNNRRDPITRISDSDPNVKVADAEKLLGGKGSNWCFDVSSISYDADLFYVHTSQHQRHMKKKNPLTDNAIEILFGELDCKTFLFYFSDRCWVTSEGQLSYDALAVTQIIRKQLHLLAPREEVQQATPEASESRVTAVPVPATVTSTGLGFPVGVTLWSSWGPHLARKAAVGGRCFALLGKRAYIACNSILQKIWRRPPQVGGKAEATDLPRVILPPFQSALYGNPQFSDFTVHLNDGIFHAHRIVLCSTSQYFKAKLGDTKHDVKTLDMKMYNPRAYRCLLKYFYTIEPENLDIIDTLDLFSLAKIYDEPRVIREVKENIKSMIDVENVTMIMEVATRNGWRELQDECELFMKTDPTLQKRYGTGAITAGISSTTGSLQTNAQQ